MALGVANAQNLVPNPNTPTVLSVPSNGSSHPLISIPPTNLNTVLSNTLQPNSNKPVPVTQPLVVIAGPPPMLSVPSAMSAASSSCIVQNGIPPAAVKLAPVAGQENGVTNNMSQNSNIHQKLMEQLTNSGMKNGVTPETDNNNEELLGFLK